MPINTHAVLLTKTFAGVHTARIVARPAGECAIAFGVRMDAEFRATNRQPWHRVMTHSAREAADIVADHKANCPVFGKK